eukprot:6894853-Karenia_brevis.AAC.1
MKSKYKPEDFEPRAGELVPPGYPRMWPREPSRDREAFSGRGRRMQEGPRESDRPPGYPAFMPYNQSVVDKARSSNQSAPEPNPKTENSQQSSSR